MEEITLKKIQDTSTLEGLIEITKAQYFQNLELQEEIKRLKELLNRNSSNSSQPPSLDKNKKNRAKRHRKKSGLKRGGQPGHKGVTRALLPSELVTDFQPCAHPDTCICGGKITGDGEYRCHQVVDIPAIIPVEVVEYQLEQGSCERCGESYSGELPSGIMGHFGTRIITLACLMRADYRMSVRKVKSFIKNLFNISISTGTLSNKEALLGLALHPMYDKIKSTIQNSVEPKHIDETGYPQNGTGKGQAWILCDEENTLFHLNPSRGNKVAKALLGETPQGIITSDRYAGYHWIDTGQRQICFAHLLRDFRKISEREGSAGVIGKELLEATENIFRVQKEWSLEEGTPDIKRLQMLVEPLKNDILSGLKKAIVCGHLTTQRTCQKILDIEDALWTFTQVSGVSLTNNLAERNLRPLVINRKLSHGTDSLRGSRFTERIFSVIATCYQQEKNSFNVMKQQLETFFDSCTFSQNQIVASNLIL